MTDQQAGGFGQAASNAAPPAAAPAPPVAWAAPAPQGPAAGIEWAGYGPRFLAYVLDGLIVGVGILVVTIVGSLVLAVADGGASRGTLTPLAAAVSLILFLVIVAVPIAYFPYFWAKTGQTPGMKPFNIRVVRDADGGKVSGGAAVVRLIGMWVSALVIYIGFIWIFLDGRRRGWHDLFAGTVVIRDPIPR